MILIPIPLEKCIVAHWFSAIRSTVLPLNLTYTLLFLLQLLSVSLRLLTFHVSNLVHFLLLTSFQRTCPSPKAPCNILNMVFFFNGEGLFAPCSILELEDQPLLDICGHIQYICSYLSCLKAITICNLRMHHAMVTKGST